MNTTPPTRRRVGGAFFLASMLVAACGWGCERKPSPPAPAQAVQSAEKQLRFVVKPRADQPLVTFTFPEPLNDYKGEAKEVSGELTIDPSGYVSTLRGFVEVKTASVTLGEPEIDSNAHSAMFMNVGTHPISRFDIQAIGAVDGGGVPTGSFFRRDLDGRSPFAFVMLGDFSLKGITVPIRVPATLSIQSSASGQPTGMTLTASWEINILKPFEIPGPSTGEAAERVLFKAELVLEKLEKGSAR